MSDKILELKKQQNDTLYEMVRLIRALRAEAKILMQYYPRVDILAEGLNNLYTLAKEAQGIEREISQEEYEDSTRLVGEVLTGLLKTLIIKEEGEENGVG